MMKDERWLIKYNYVLGLMEQKHRNFSKHRI
jgi:hypothetical protein